MTTNKEPNMAKGNTWKWLLSLLAVVLKPILSAITPLIKELFEDSLNKLLEKARATENPVDDYFVELLFNIVDLEIPEEE